MWTQCAEGETADSRAEIAAKTGRADPLRTFLFLFFSCRSVVPVCAARIFWHRICIRQWDERTHASRLLCAFSSLLLFFFFLSFYKSLRTVASRAVSPDPFTRCGLIQPALVCLVAPQFTVTDTDRIHMHAYSYSLHSVLPPAAASQLQHAVRGQVSAVIALRDARIAS